MVMDTVVRGWPCLEKGPGKGEEDVSGCGDPNAGGP